MNLTMQKVRAQNRHIKSSAVPSTYPVTPIPKTYHELCNLLDRSMHFKNILCINTNITGLFLDKMFSDAPKNKIIHRIKYYPTNYKILETEIQQLNTTYDLICLDPYHEPNYTTHNLTLLVSYLNDGGILVCHDCNPPNKVHVRPYFTPNNSWCGVTYAEFIGFACAHPEWFYAVIEYDYGLGIISKQPALFVQPFTPCSEQQVFLEMYKDTPTDAYKYFKKMQKKLSTG